MKSVPLAWRIVLVRPRNPLNIGAAARAMANFGFRELVAVAPYGPTWQETRSAVGAEDVVRSARAVDGLLDAIGDATLVIGTTAGAHRTLDREPIPLPELPSWLAENATKRSRATLVFGSEKHGLTNEDMSHCHAIVRIPTSPENTARLLIFVNGKLRYDATMPVAIAGRIPKERIGSIDWHGGGSIGQPDGDGIFVIQNYQDAASAIVFFSSGVQLLSRRPKDFHTLPSP